MVRSVDEYRHVQIGYLLIVIFGVLLAIVIFLIVVTGITPLFIGVLAFLAVALGVFATLTVVVDNKAITAEFYLGLPRKTIAVREVAHYRIVRNPWYYGWGVRYTPHGWLYRVSGSAAIEIESKRGRRFRIGTDEPERFAEAIERALRNSDA